MGKIKFARYHCIYITAIFIGLKIKDLQVNRTIFSHCCSLEHAQKNDWWSIEIAKILLAKHKVL